MRRLTISLVSVSAVLLGASMPLSLSWSPEKMPSVGVDQAQAQAPARIARPTPSRSVARVSRRTARRAVPGAGAAAVGAAAVGAAAVGAAATGAYIGATAPFYGPGPYWGGYWGPSPYYGAGPYPAVAAVAPGPAPAGAIIVNPVTGRWCRTAPNGYQWCWTP